MIREAPAPGQRLGPYRLIAPLGSGGAGSVWRAVAEGEGPLATGTAVAIKLLHRIGPEQRRRAAREIAALQSLAHPGIVRLLDWGESAGLHWLAMELVEGRRFDALLAEGPLASARAAELIADAAAAMAAAHRAGILHRDLKPSNLILADDGRVVIVDFGLAIALDQESRITASDRVLGTPAYMSPEQARGERARVGPASDVYALGAVLYELLTGVPPFRADDARALLRLAAEATPPPPARLRPDLPRALDAIVRCAMARELEDRYASAADLAADLRRFLAGLPPRARPPQRWRAVRRWLWRRRRALALSGLAVFLALNALALGVRAALRQPPADWVLVQAWDDPCDERDGAPRAPALLGPGLEARALGPVSGPARLSAVLQWRGSGEARLLLNDRDLGRGYQARLARSAAGELALELARDGVLLAALTLPQAPAQHAATLTREEDAVRLLIDDRPAIALREPLPLSGSGSYLIVSPGAVTVQRVRLERLRRAAALGALAPADALREDGRYQKALSMYEAMLAEYPAEPLRAALELRAALCVLHLGREQEALRRAARLAEQQETPSALRAYAALLAWAASVRLQQDAEALRWLLQGAGAVTPRLALPLLPGDAAPRWLHVAAGAVRTLEPLSDAARLGDVVADLAAAAAAPTARCQALCDLGDRLLAGDDAAGALARFLAVTEDAAAAPSERARAWLKAAEAWRVLGDAEAAARAYRRAAAHESFAAWAWLWLGDLYDERGEHSRARQCWQEALAGQGLPAACAQALLTGAAPPEAEEGLAIWYHNDVAYFRGRLAERRQDWAAARAAYQAAAQGDWPAPLARRRLSMLP
ncbi:MAG: serine/threonine protein kinase [Planctomycetota bacterium]|nr:serine/threonine protein kinase [Planctomycetota bacterium]